MLTVLLSYLVGSGHLNDMCRQIASHDVCTNGTFYNIIVGLIVFLCIKSVISLICSSMMIHGVNKNVPRLMVPMIIMMVVDLILSGVIGVAQLVLLHNIKFLFQMIGSILLGIYYILVVRSYYYELKRGQNTVGAEMEAPKNIVGFSPQTQAGYYGFTNPPPSQSPPPQYSATVPPSQYPPSQYPPPQYDASGKGGQAV